MNTFYIVLIVAAALAVVFALLWFCYICQSQDESKYQDTRVPNVDDVELGLEKRPARNPQIGIKRNRALIVREVLEKDIPIPNLTKKKHVYSGSPSQFTEEKAIEISVRREKECLENGSNKNTVFQEPAEFWLCNTSDQSYPELAISRQPVEIFQCVKDPETSKWTALYVGKYNVLLGRKAIVADHFVGYFYSRIIFPE